MKIIKDNHLYSYSARTERVLCSCLIFSILLCAALLWTGLGPSAGNAFCQMEGNLSQDDNLSLADRTKFVINQADYQIKVKENIAFVQARYLLECFDDNLKVKLLSGDISVSKPPDLSKYLTFIPVPGGYGLYIERKGRYELGLEFVVNLRQSDAGQGLGFWSPDAVINHLVIEIEQSDIEVKVDQGQQVASRLIAGKITRVEAFLTRTDHVGIAWQPKPPQISKLKALSYVEEEAVYEIEPGGSIRMNTSLLYRLIQGSLEQLDIELPANSRVLSVKGQAIKTWQVGEDNILSLKLYQPIEADYRLELKTEQVLEQLPHKLKMGGLKAIGSQRQSGHIAFNSGRGLKVEVLETEGLSQLNPGELPAGMISKDSHLVGGYHYLSNDYWLKIDINRLSAQVKVASQVKVELKEWSIELTARLKYQIDKAGIFQIRIDIPAGYSLVEVTAEGIEGYEKIAVDGDREQILIKLASRRIGEYEVGLVLEKPVKEAIGQIEIGSISASGVVQERGLVGIVTELPLKIKPEQTEGLTQIGLEELWEDLTNRASLAYRYSSGKWNLVLNSEPIEPVVTAEIFNLAGVSEGYVSGTNTISYRIENAPVQEFMIELPAGLKNLELTGPNIRSKDKIEAIDRKADKDDKAHSREIWQVILHSKVKGRYSLVVSYERGIEVSSAEPVEIPVIKTLGTERESGYIAICGRGNLELTSQAEKTKGIDIIDTEELPSDYIRLVKLPVLLAYRYIRQPWELTLVVTKYKDIEVLQAIANQVEITSVLSEDGQLMTQAIYWLKNNVRQFLRINLPEGSELWSSFVAGKAVRPGREGEQILLPLERKSGREDVFSAEIIYVESKKRLGIKGKVELEAPHIDIPAKNTVWSLYLPARYRYFKFAGNMKKKHIDKTPVLIPLTVAGLRDVSQYGVGLASGPVSRTSVQDVQFKLMEDMSARTPQMEVKQMPPPAIQQVPVESRLEGLQALPPKAEPAAITERQAEQIVIAQKPSVARVLPFKIDLPLEGIRHVFAKSLSTEPGMSLNLSFSFVKKGFKLWIFKIVILVIILVFVLLIVIKLFKISTS